mgnify:FL=1|tara:strand:- start:108 stop:524 length:417 start_codon:yes stop_codon:yes gene_type:complete
MKKILLLSAIVSLVSCSDFWWASSDVTPYLSLQVKNYNSEFSIVKVSLINNEFEDLNIVSGGFQVFELTNLVEGDLSWSSISTLTDINILVDIDCIAQGAITLSTQLDFSSGTAIISINDSNYDADVIMNCEDAAIYQ